MSRIFIDKFHHCWLLKCSKSWTKKKVFAKATKLQESKKKEHIHCVIAFWFRYILLFCFMLALCCARRFWLAFEQWLQKILLTGAKIFMGPIESRTQKKEQSMLYAGLIGACACATCIGWLSLLKSQCFCTFFSLCSNKSQQSFDSMAKMCANEHLFIVQGVLCDCFVVAVVFDVMCIVLLCICLAHISCVMMPITEATVFFHFGFCAVCDSVQHKVSNWTNALIYCDPFGLSLEYSIAIVTLQIFGVKIFPSFFSLPFDAFVFCSVIFVSHFVSHL